MQFFIFGTKQILQVLYIFLWLQIRCIVVIMTFNVYICLVHSKSSEIIRSLRQNPSSERLSIFILYLTTLLLLSRSSTYTIIIRVQLPNRFNSVLYSRAAAFGCAQLAWARIPHSTTSAAAAIATTNLKKNSTRTLCTTAGARLSRAAGYSVVVVAAVVTILG